MPSSPHNPSRGNAQGIPSSTPHAEAAGAVAHAQAMPRHFPSVFHRSLEVASCYDALLSALLSWQRTLGTTAPGRDDGGGSEGKDEGLQGSGTSGGGRLLLLPMLPRPLSLSDREELQRLRSAYEAGNVATVLGSTCV